MIKGVTKNVALSPIPYKDLDPEETFAPYQIDLRNGRLTDAGNWEKRNGFAEWIDTSVLEEIKLLIPVNNGYIVTGAGKIYSLTSTPSSTPLKLPISLNGGYRPTWDRHGDLIILCDGSDSVKVEANNSVLLGGNPPKAKFVSRISSYTVMSGHDPTEFKWSASGNPENWSTGDSGFANIKEDGDSIKNMKVLKEKLFFFKDRSIEVWYNRGGATPFVRLNELWINKGCGADYSPVEANNTLYWLGNDGDFYFLNGAISEVISKSYRSYLDTNLKNPSSVYGFDCRKENCIRWFSPIDGLCFKYDYLKNYFSEDNTWEHGQFERLNWNSYMELNGEQYFGDYDPTGKVYHWSKDYKDDNGKEIRVTRKFKVKLSDKGHNSNVNRLRLMLKRGVATDSEINPKMIVRWHFDEFPYWKTEEIDMGTKNDKDPYVDIHRLGMGKEIEIEVVETDAVDYLLMDALLTVDEKGK